MQLPAASDPRPLRQSDPALTTLDLSHSYVGPEGATDLAIRLKANTLSDLNLRDTYLGTPGCITIAEVLQANTTLRSLDISHCLIDFDGGDAIVDRGAKAIADALRANKTLRVLHISFNGIGPKGAIAIALALQENSTLQKLTFYHTHLSVAEQIKFIEIVEANTFLTSIQFFYSESPLQERIDALVKRNAAIVALKTAVTQQNVLEILTTLDQVNNAFPTIESPLSTLSPILITAYNNCWNKLWAIILERMEDENQTLNTYLDLISSTHKRKESLVNVLFSQPPNEHNGNDAERYKAILYLLRYDLDDPFYYRIINTCIVNLQSKKESLAEIESRSSILTTEHLISFDRLKQAARSVTERYQSAPDSDTYNKRIQYFTYLTAQSYSIQNSASLLRWPDIRAALNLSTSVIMLEDFLVNPNQCTLIKPEEKSANQAQQESLADTLFHEALGNRITEYTALRTIQRFLNNTSWNNPITKTAAPSLILKMRGVVNNNADINEILKSLKSIAQEMTAGQQSYFFSQPTQARTGLTFKYRAFLTMITEATCLDEVIFWINQQYENNAAPLEAPLAEKIDLKMGRHALVTNHLCEFMIKVTEQLIEFEEAYQSLCRLKKTHITATRAQDKLAYDSVVNTSKTTTYTEAVKQHYSGFIKTVLPKSYAKRFINLNTAEYIRVLLATLDESLNAIRNTKAYDSTQDKKPLKWSDIFRGVHTDIALLEWKIKLDNLTCANDVRMGEPEERIGPAYEMLCELTEYIGINGYQNEKNNDFTTLQFYFMQDMREAMNYFLRNMASFLILCYRTLIELFEQAKIHTSPMFLSRLEANIFKLTYLLEVQFLQKYPAFINYFKEAKAGADDASTLSLYKQTAFDTINVVVEVAQIWLQHLALYCTKFPSNIHTDEIFIFMENIKFQMSHFDMHSKRFDQESEQIIEYQNNTSDTPLRLSTSPSQRPA